MVDTDRDKIVYLYSKAIAAVLIGAQAEYGSYTTAMSSTDCSLLVDPNRHAKCLIVLCDFLGNQLTSGGKFRM